MAGPRRPELGQCLAELTSMFSSHTGTQQCDDHGEATVAICAAVLHVSLYSISSVYVVPNCNTLYREADLCIAPTKFCKCTCFSNSTIIPLDSTNSAPDSSSTSDSNGTFHPRSCSDCNKQFCLDYSLPICADAKEADVFTTCFQRDSAKDEAVVFIFIFATVGLLAWAAVKPWVLKWRDSARMRHTYAPVGGSGGDVQ